MRFNRNLVSIQTETHKMILRLIKKENLLKEAKVKAIVRLMKHLSLYKKKIILNNNTLRYLNN